MKKLMPLLAVFAALAATSAQADDTIKIGMYGPLTGPSATGGISFRKGWEYAAQEINASGGLMVDGKKKRIELLIEDSQSRPEVGLTAAQKLLTRDNVDILIGDMVSSDVTLATMELSPSFPKLFYTGEAISTEIAKKIASDPKKFANVWKHNFSSNSYASTVHDTLLQLVAEGKIKPKNKTVAVIAEDTGFSKPIVEAMIPLLAKDGWKVSVNESVPMGQSDFFPQISKIRQADPDYLVSIFTAMNSGTAVVKQLREQGVKTMHIAVNYPTLANFMAGAGPAADGLIFTPMLFDPINNKEQREFSQKMKAFVGAEPDNNNLDAYCNATLLADAITRAGSVEVGKLSKAMGTTDFTCLSSRRVFDPASHAPRIGDGYYQVPAGQIQGGKFVVVWPKANATAAFRAP